MKDKTTYFLFFGIVALILGIVYMGLNSKWTNAYDALFVKYANKHGLDWKMLKAVAMNESSLGKNKGYEPRGGTTGLMQIQLQTAIRFIKGITASELVDDEKQIEAAAGYLAFLKKKFNGDNHKIIISYNQGEGNTAKGKDYTKDYYTKYINHYQEIA
jgi:membrane-bound lytic murein transglycosylase MltF